MHRKIITAVSLLFITAALVHAQTGYHPRLIVTGEAMFEELRQVTHPGDTEPDWNLWSERERVSRLAYRSIYAAATKALDYEWDNNYWGKECFGPGYNGHQGAQFHGLVTLALAHNLCKDETGYVWPLRQPRPRSHARMGHGQSVPDVVV